MSTQDSVWNNLLAGTPWGDLTIELPLPSYNFQQQFCEEWANSIQSWGDLEDPISVINPPEELDEYENMPGLTSAEEAWSEYTPVEEFSAAAPLEVAPEEDLMDPIPIVETAAATDVSCREEGL